MTVLDRVENGVAYLSAETGLCTCDASLLAADIREGDVLQFDGAHWVRDEAGTEVRRQRMRARLNRLVHREKQ